MNKKQAVIIVTLLALIICVGVVATKLNSPINYVNGVDNGNGKSTISLNDNTTNKATQTQAKSQFFEETRLTRDQKNAETLQTLKSLIDDTNASQENRAEAEKKYTQLAMATNYEMKIENTLKSKGYEDAICSIENEKARVIIKGKDKLTDKDTRVIKDIVMSVSQIQDVEIQVKQS
ncbi:SpoIIIAH-like family protein [Clostridium luticellarii]|jgi:stage III sporulation protein AH|uniref:Stage III sporulation protein AH n=1 Tax=Clostridium luticellarii TaxID=1691940 RepID=A0A2T0BRN9_9CLOT|nr:SpoIIIAH-like family protein [Clostridium luticellarii]MCI1943750.1 SpoIIIAH-like family protein [Clostridium luticellarii]MCI1967011.1 SpoIIIAH-like family protein [Clostridium luticellarii]MCI1994378.1 SpoIIIAH-like family protein [Clostridium luticellarii]MCI2038669.1 SpoIIIAH-like family protein [Clostridium luticellarii]PRR86544.1 Stage III sporulation protein AH [Clostridium luticellarii]